MSAPATLADWLDRIKPVDGGTVESRAHWLGQEIAMELCEAEGMDPVFAALSGPLRVTMGMQVQRAAVPLLQALLREIFPAESGAGDRASMRDGNPATDDLKPDGLSPTEKGGG